MSDFKVHVDAFLKDLKKFHKSLAATTTKTLKHLSEIARDHAKQTTKFQDRTGALRKSIKSGIKGPYNYYTQVGGADAPYAEYIENGSEPHVIEARRAIFLRFEKNGEIIFRRRVWHPGTKAAKFMAAARDYTEDQAEAVVRARFRKFM